mmetsp:Transcript_17537/g.36328  ORF Transcript_17537/g.36328 Transcript_17537/m.36328 type:complete len:242 (+) Transcript_17537:1226-1951(+)
MTVLGMLRKKVKEILGSHKVAITQGHENATGGALGGSAVCDRDNFGGWKLMRCHHDMLQTITNESGTIHLENPSVARATNGPTFWTLGAVLGAMDISRIGCTALHLSSSGLGQAKTTPSGRTRQKDVHALHGIKIPMIVRWWTCSVIGSFRVGSKELQIQTNRFVTTSRRQIGERKDSGRIQRLDLLGTPSHSQVVGVGKGVEGMTHLHRRGGCRLKENGGGHYGFWLSFGCESCCCSFGC